MMGEKIFFKALFSLFFSLFVFSLLASNPSQPAILQEGVYFSDQNILSSRIGMEYRYIENPKWTFSIADKEKGYHSPKARISSLAPSFILNVKERWDLIVQPGAFISRIEYGKKEADFSAKTKLGFYGKTAFRAILLERKETSLGLDASCFVFASHLHKFMKNENELLAAMGKLQIKGWDVSLGLSQKLHFFIPYIGTFWHEERVKFRHFPKSDSRLLLDSRRGVGLFLGTSMSKGSKILFNVEGKFIQQSSINASFEIRL